MFVVAPLQRMEPGPHSTLVLLSLSLAFTGGQVLNIKMANGGVVNHC